MATIKVKLRELRNADCRFISLVDRAATRIGFRVLKQEGEMTLDLTKVVKGEQEPQVTAVVVFTQKSEELNEAVRKAITEAGFETNRVRKADEGETTVYAQQDSPEGDSTLVRLSDQMVIAVKGLTMPQEGFAAKAAEHGFYPGVDMAAEALQAQLSELPSEGFAEKAEELVAGFAQYAATLTQNLPAACFKADAAVNAVLKGGETTSLKGLEECLSQAPKSMTGTDWLAMPIVDRIKWYTTWYQDNEAKVTTPAQNPDTNGAKDQGATVPVNPNLQDTNAPAAGPKDNEDTKGKQPQGATSDSPSTAVKGKCEKCGKEECKGDCKVEKGVCQKCKKEACKGECDPAPPVVTHRHNETEKTYKEDLQAVLDAVNGLKDVISNHGNQLQEVATKVEAVQKSQEDQKKELDAVAKKAETLSGKLAGTVSAPVTPEDTPSSAVTIKSDEDGDPRSAPEGGSWDTAFARKRERIARR